MLAAAAVLVREVENAAHVAQVTAWIRTLSAFYVTLVATVVQEPKTQNVLLARRAITHNLTLRIPASTPARADTIRTVPQTPVPHAILVVLDALEQATQIVLHAMVDITVSLLQLPRVSQHVHQATIIIPPLVPANCLPIVQAAPQMKILPT